ncbi:MAG: NlpC/P60 family protein [Streptosporangiaceae bacterium]
MERLPVGRLVRAQRAGIRHLVPDGRLRRGRGRRRLARGAVLIGAFSVATMALPAAAGSASSAPVSPTLARTLARANKLSNEIDSLGQQYDGLKIELGQARSEVRIARQLAQRDERLLSASRAAIGRIAAAGYMTGGLSPALQLLQSSAPQTLLNRASIMTQLQQENGDQVTAVQAAEQAARRAELTARQQQQRATKLAAAMKSKVAAIQSREDVLNSAAFTEALQIYQRTHRYPNINVAGDSIGAQALRYALTRLGDPYVWGGAGPSDFDCSGLVMWSYAQVGISLEHYTGDQWNEGEHIPRSQIEPGDLLFFFNLDHVGMYVGHGLMVDAPTYGQPVQIQPVYWSAFDGAVRIVA